MYDGGELRENHRRSPNPDWRLEPSRVCSIDSQLRLCQLKAGHDA